MVKGLTAMSPISKGSPAWKYSTEGSQVGSSLRDGGRFEGWLWSRFQGLASLTRVDVGREFGSGFEVNLEFGVVGVAFHAAASASA